MAECGESTNARRLSVARRRDGRCRCQQRESIYYAKRGFMGKHESESFGRRRFGAILQRLCSRGVRHFQFRGIYLRSVDRDSGRVFAIRCKFTPSIYSVGPLLCGTTKVVKAGGTITISGNGFGKECSTSGVTAANPSPTALQVLSWSNTTITALLPASFGIGIATIGVTTGSGSDAINRTG
jgi:hypothetical protein